MSWSRSFAVQGSIVLVAMGIAISAGATELQERLNAYLEERVRETGSPGLTDPARVSGVYPYNRRHAPSSTLNSSVSEMTRWMLANLGQGELDGQRILEPANHAALWTATTDTSREGMQVGLSWFLSEHEGHRAVAHGGGDTGFRSQVMLLPDERVGVVLASNWTGTDPFSLVRGILDRVLAD